MGIVYIKGNLSNNGREEEVDLLVDSGSTYTLVTKKVWNNLKLEPKREMEFILADGRKVKRFLSEAYIKIPSEGVEGHSPVILGEEGDDENLLGAVTLEILGLILDPLKRELLPIRAILK